jgi:hypothetical protein
MKHQRPAMGEMSLAQQSRSFNGYVRHLPGHMRRMLRTAREQGYTDDQLRQLCRTRADTLRAKAAEIENLMQ